MKGKKVLAKRWQRYLLATMFFLLTLVVGCQIASYAKKPSIIEETEQIVAEAAPEYYSNLSPEDCSICGEGKETALPLYRGQENIGIINLNTFDLVPVTINRYDDFGNLIEKLSRESVTHITNTGKDGFFLSVTADTDRGYAHVHLSFDKDEVLDMKKTVSYLCSDCLKRTMDSCWSDAPLSMGVINFRTGEIQLFDEQILAFMFGDYYISYNSQDKNEGDWRNIDLLIFYCPERYRD